MGFLDTVTSWLKREAADVKESVDALGERLDADLSRRERELEATPEERIEMIQADSGVDDALAEIQDKIDRAQASAEANSDLIERDDTEQEG